MFLESWVKFVGVGILVYTGLVYRLYRSVICLLFISCMSWGGFFFF